MPGRRVRVRAGLQGRRNSRPLECGTRRAGHPYVPAAPRSEEPGTEALALRLPCCPPECRVGLMVAVLAGEPAVVECLLFGGGGLTCLLPQPGPLGVVAVEYLELGERLVHPPLQLDEVGVSLRVDQG